MSVSSPNDNYKKILAAKQKAIQLETNRLVQQHNLKLLNQSLDQRKGSVQKNFLSPNVQNYAVFGDDAPDTTAGGTPVAANTTDPAMLRMFLDQQVDAVNARVDQAEQEFNKVNQAVKTAQSRMRGNAVSNNSAADLKANMNNALPPWLRPGNVGEINRVIWPFWFTAVAPVMPAQSTGKSSISITQEAAFVCCSFTKSFYKEATPDAGDFIYVDPANFASQNGISPGLTITLRDASSSRTFSDKPQDINHYGWWQQPTVLPRPIMFLPNGQLEISWANQSDNVYLPFITFFGYRVRIEAAQNLLGLVTG